MQEYAAEIEGTLARKAQRKNTVLSQIHRQRQADRKEAKFGFAIRPRDPQAVESFEAARHFLNEVRSEINHHMSRLNRPNLLSIEKDGEATVRQVNDAIHQLMHSHHRWLFRCSELCGGDPSKFTDEELKVIDDVQAGRFPRKRFFGCALQLPEAAAQREKREGKLREAAAAASRKRDRDASSHDEKGRQHQSGDDDDDDDTMMSGVDGGVDVSDDEGENAEKEESGLLALMDNTSAIDEERPSQGSSSSIVEAYMRRVAWAVGRMNGDDAMRRDEARADDVFMKRRQRAASLHVSTMSASAPQACPAGTASLTTTTYLVDLHIPNTAVANPCEQSAVPSDAVLKAFLFARKKAAMLAQTKALSAATASVPLSS